MSFEQTYAAEVAELVRPLNPDDGLPEPAIAAAEERLGCRLPAVLRRFYAVAGALDEVNTAHDTLFGPGELAFDPTDTLVFYEAHQGVCAWGIPRALLEQDDPPVFQSPSEGDWYREEPTLSAFLLKTLYKQLAFGESSSCFDFDGLSDDQLADLRARCRAPVDSEACTVFRHGRWVIYVEGRWAMCATPDEEELARMREFLGPAWEPETKSPEPTAFREVHWRIMEAKASVLEGDVDALQAHFADGFGLEDLTNDGLTLLEVAARCGQAGMVRIFLGWGANTAGALGWAAAAGHYEIARILVEAEADLERPPTNEPHDSTPLLLATACGHTELVELLLNSGADPSAKNAIGMRPLDLAQKPELKALFARAES